MQLKLVFIVIFTLAQVAHAQYGNFGGFGWSAGQWGATLAQQASTPPTRLPGDAQFKQHDIDYAIRNVDSSGGLFSQQGWNVHRAMVDRVTGNHFQHQPLHDEN